MSKVEGREALAEWKRETLENSFSGDHDFRHSVAYHFPERTPLLENDLEAFADVAIKQVEPLVAENNREENLPRIMAYDGIGNRIDTIVHHPSYVAAGNLIYGSGMLERMARKGNLTEGLLFFFLSSQCGEAGHNCPIACSYGIIRLLRQFPDIPQSALYLKKLTTPSYDSNYTGAQFVTEVQGGSDAGLNAVAAALDSRGDWRVSGEKWFCSNADAELMLVTARYDPSVEGTRGLGLFLVPATLETGERNSYILRRLKDKLGTRSLATAEIEFNSAYAIPIGKPEEGFKLLMEHALHSSRLFNTVSVMGMGRRALKIAHAYAKHRKAFGRAILEYPLVQQNLALVKAENTAIMASLFATAKLQDDQDLAVADDPKGKLLLRHLANVNKYLSALWTVEHIHHCLDVLAGNGTIETFSPIPLLLRDSIICENWEGTHNVLRMQALRDALKYDIDEIFCDYMERTLQKIVQGVPHKGEIEEGVKELRSLFKKLKQSPPDVQTLLIKECFDKMGITFAAVHLLLEAMDQQSKGNNSKMRCMDYFAACHLSKESKPTAEEELKLIQLIL